MIRRAFIRRLGLGAAAVAVSPLDAFKMPEVVPWRFEPESEVGDLLVENDLSGLTRLVHEIYMGEVLPAVRMGSPMAKIFADTADHYALHGEKLVFQVDVT